MVSETFEQVLTAAEAAGSMTPAWKKFVNTKFFVPVMATPDNKTTLRLAPHPDTGGHVIRISEVRDRLDTEQGSLTALNGADIVRLLHVDASILIALSDRAFHIAADKAEWLRKGVEASRARAAAKAREIAQGAKEARAAAPVAAAVPAPAPAPAPIPAPIVQPVAKPAAARGGPLDVAALKPRNVAMEKFGLDFFVPGDWRESAMGTGLRFRDPGNVTLVEVSGFHKPNTSLAQWVATRQALVTHELRYLQPDGPAYRIDGDGWRDRISGMAMEYTGTVPGDTAPCRYLVACIRMDDTLVALTIRAPAEQFEQDRALYKWMLGRIDMQAVAPAVTAGAGARGADMDADMEVVDDPGAFGMSTQGRIGRLRAMAYFFPIYAVMIGLAVLGAFMLGKGSAVFGGLLLVVSLVGLLWTFVRLLILRLHDLDLSGKWLLGLICAWGAAGAMHNILVSIVIALATWLGTIVVVCILPGTKGENSYGPPPGPNSLLVQIGAGLFILLNLASGFGNARYGNLKEHPLAMPGAASEKSMTFMAVDGAFSVSVPGMPKEVRASPVAAQGVSQGILHQYLLATASAHYFMQSVDVGAAIVDRDGAMDKMRAGVIGSDGTLITDQLVLFNGLRGREVQVKLANGDLRAARFVFAGSRLSLAMIETRDNADGKKRINDFLSSFDVR